MVNKDTLKRRRAGITARRDTVANSRKLTVLEEETIIHFIVDLCNRAFPPHLSSIKDMANQLLRIHDAPPVGKRWAMNFIKRQPELCTRWARRYD